MILGRVIGDVVATSKHPTHEAIKLLLVRETDAEGNERGAPFIAVDTLDAGVGDNILLTLDGWAAMTAVRRRRAPIDAAIIAIVDEVEWNTPSP